MHVSSPGGSLSHRISGFASYARSFEVIQNAGYSIRDIDIRFIKPNLLPNFDLAVQVARTADKSGQRKLRLIGKNGDIYLAGHFIAA